MLEMARSNSNSTSLFGRKVVSILHVDDDPSIINISKQILEIDGKFQVEPANSMKEALSKMAQKNYDAVISDYKLPQQDGLAFLKLLREQQNQIPFILFIGKGSEQVAIKALNLGANAYISKQGNPETVYGELAHVLLKMADRINSKQLQAESLDLNRLLVDKLNVLGSFTRHDVRNKIAAINGQLYLAKKKIKHETALLNAFEQIKSASDNIIRILDFAATYEKLGNEKLALIDVGRVIDDMASLFSDMKGVSINNECRGFKVVADQMLTTIFQNLIDNSLKYGQNLNYIKISNQKDEDGTIRIIYEDNGAGIEEEFRNMLFVKGVGKGTGYGLYLLKRICEMYGWTVKETGEFGKGARFEFRIPRSKN
jgi:signal transduction histidine kinase